MSYNSVKALLNTGVSRPTLFEVLIADAGNLIDRQVNDHLRFLCKTATVPEVSVDTLSVNGQEAMGLVRQQAALVTYAKPFSISVVSDREYTVYKAMRNWFNTLAVNANPFSLGSGGVGVSQTINYYSGVTKNIILRKLEQNGNRGYYEPFQITFNNAYPVRVGQLDLDTEAYDRRMDFNIDFTYENYTFSAFGDDRGFPGGASNPIEVA